MLLCSGTEAIPPAEFLSMFKRAWGRPNAATQVKLESARGAAPAAGKTDGSVSGGG